MPIVVPTDFFDTRTSVHDETTTLDDPEPVVDPINPIPPGELDNEGRLPAGARIKTRTTTHCRYRRPGPAELLSPLFFFPPDGAGYLFRETCGVVFERFLVTPAEEILFERTQSPRPVTVVKLVKVCPGPRVFDLGDVARLPNGPRPPPWPPDGGDRYVWNPPGEIEAAGKHAYNQRRDEGPWHIVVTHVWAPDGPVTIGNCVVVRRYRLATKTQRFDRATNTPQGNPVILVIPDGPTQEFTWTIPGCGDARGRTKG